MSIWRDLRYAARSLRRAPGFTAVAVVVLAVGIGANSAMFSLVDAALLRPLPFTQPDRLVMLWERSPRFPHNRVSPLNFLDWSEQQQAFSSIAAIAGGGRTLTGSGGEAERIPGQAVTWQFFDVLGIRPVIGATFTAGDTANRRTVVVLSERLWKNRFGGDPSIVGRDLTLDGQPYTVIGVVPASFQILFPADMWTLFSVRRSPEQRRQHYMQVIGRLKPGATLEQAQADMAGVADRIASIAPDTNKGWGVTIEPLRGAIVGPELRTTSLVLAGVVSFVLLMACANVANLLLARGLSRSREIAVRAALGGSRTRIIQQLLTESLLLAAIGGASGLALAWAAVRTAPALIPRGTLPEAIVLSFDARVALVAALLTVSTALLFGMVPAWQASSVPLAEMTSAGGRGSTKRAGGLRAALVIGEVAAAVLLLTGAGLLVRTLIALNSVDPGFRAAHVLTMQLGLPLNRYRDHREAGRVLSGGGARHRRDSRGDERGIRRQPAARRLGHRPGLHHRRGGARREFTAAVRALSDRQRQLLPNAGDRSAERADVRRARRRARPAGVHRQRRIRAPPPGWPRSDRRGRRRAEHGHDRAVGNRAAPGRRRHPSGGGGGRREGAGDRNLRADHAEPVVLSPRSRCGPRAIRWRCSPP